MAGKALEKHGGGVTPYRSTNLPAITAEEVRARVNLIQQVKRGVMKSDVHYGKIPGAGDKPMLFKAGAELLAVTFQLAPDPEVEDLSTSDNVRYRVRVRMTSQQTGAFLGAGVGEASSDEEKYKWRAAVCDEEYDETAEDRRRNKWRKGGYENGRWNRNVKSQVKQVRTNPADVANTVLKMAKKRAQVDATLSITGASDVFGQDLEDLPDELRTSLVEEVIDAEIVDDEPAEPETIAEIRAVAATKVLKNGKPVTEKSILANLKRQHGYEGKLDGITQAVAESVLSGISSLEDAPQDAASSTETAENGDATPSEGTTAPEGKAAKNPRLAKLCILWSQVVEKDLDSDDGLRDWIDSAYGTKHRSELSEEQQGEVIEALERSLVPA